MKRKSLFNIILLIILLNFLLINCKTKEKSKKKDKKKDKKKEKEKKTKNKNKEEENETNIIPSLLNWAKNNSIYISDKIVLNKKLERDKYYYFSADSRIPNNTLLFKVPYNMWITQFSLNEIYKGSKNKKYEKLWDKLTKINNEYIKYFSTKQLLYMSIILENAIRKKKGPIYKKYKEYLRLYDKINTDIYPIFYDEQEKQFLSGSNFGSLIFRADKSLNEEYMICNSELDLNIPNEDDFYKTRVIALVSSTDLKNENLNYTNGFNETVIIPLLDCFNKVISEDKSNARFQITSTKNETNNYINYYLEIYSNDEIFLGGEINLKWRPFPNTELLLYYGKTEEDNPYSSRYYIDIMNQRLKKLLNITEDKKYDNLKRNIYELNTEIGDPSLIEIYKDLSVNFERYKGKEEGAYEMMLDNLKAYLDLYTNYLTDGNINIRINGNEKIKDIKEILHSEKNLVENKIEYLKQIIKNIKEKNKIDQNEKEDL